MKKLLLLPLTLLLLGGFQTAVAADCVEVDIELPDTVVAEAGAFADGYFELINCGDEGAVITLDITIDINGDIFPIGGLGIPMGAGEVLSREFHMPVPPAAAGWTVTICVTATSGEAEDSDCATMVVVGPPPPVSSEGKSVTFLMASADDCVDIDLELPDTVTNSPGSFVEGSIELINCGDEADTISTSVSIELFDTTISIPGPVVILGAGESISREFRFPVPPAVPPGTYVFCVTATAGDAMATSCQTVEVVGMKAGSPDVRLQNFPNPFNPSTTIQFELPVTTRVTMTIYNVLGQNVRTLKDEVMEAGTQTVEWDGTDDNGNRLSSGIYFYRIEAGDLVVSKKMMMIK